MTTPANPMSRLLPPDEALFNLIKAGKLNEIKVIPEIATVIQNTRDADENTVLHVAALYGKIDAAKYFIEHKVDPKQVNNRGQNFLHCAAETPKTNLTDFVDLAKEAKVDIDAQDKHGRTALWTLICDPQNLWLKISICAQRYGLGDTPLQEKAKHNRRKSIQKMLAYGANVNHKATNEQKEECLIIYQTMMLGMLDIAHEMIIHWNADITLQGKKGGVLHAAVRIADLDWVLSLTKKLSIHTINAVNENGETALHCLFDDAQDLLNPAFSKILNAILAKKPDVNIKEKRLGHSPLNRLAYSWSNSSTQIWTTVVLAMIDLLKAGAKINSCDHRGRTPLHNVLDPCQYTAAKYRMPATRFLLGHNAPVNQADGEGITPLMLAAGATEIGRHHFFPIDEALYDLIVSFGGNSELVTKNGMCAAKYTSMLVEVLNADEPSMSAAGFSKPASIDKAPLSKYFVNDAKLTSPTASTGATATAAESAQPASANDHSISAAKGTSSALTDNAASKTCTLL